jgi:para-aminobenzoate synthetase component 1
MYCRFENRPAGRALQLVGFCQRIEARTPQELPGALAAIESARLAGRWVALMLDYELGEWLLPEVVGSASAASSAKTAASAEVTSSANTIAPAEVTGSPVDPASALEPPAHSDGVARQPDTNRPRLRALVFDGALREAPWPVAEDAGCRVERAEPRVPQPRYLEQVQAIRDGISRGDYYQVNYTLPLDVRVQGDPRELYARIADRNPVAHAAYIEDGTQVIMSFSPELFVSKRGATLTTRPMKGTAPRDADPLKDEALGRALRDSEKNRAENLMIVDLLRNDLGRIAQPGTVQVEQLFTLERYPTVWTMTSTITAQAPHATLESILRALFPCGSITGAPKIAAMRRIRELESAPRGLYCGSLGWLAPNGDFSLNVAIRTMVLDNTGTGTYGVGGGIVHDSDPLLEWQECLWKARILQH